LSNHEEYDAFFSPTTGISTYLSFTSSILGNPTGLIPGLHTDTIHYTVRAGTYRDGEPSPACEALPIFSANNTWTVSVVYWGHCEASVQQHINFGVIGEMDTDLYANGAVAVKCPLGQDYQVYLGEEIDEYAKYLWKNGEFVYYYDEEYGYQTGLNTASAIPYQVYMDENHTQILTAFGEGSSENRIIGVGTGSFQYHTLYGKALAPSTPPLPGMYMDTKVIVVRY